MMNDTIKMVFSDMKPNILDDNEYSKEYVVFSREKAIKTIVKLIENADEIEIFHKKLYNNTKYKNIILDAINKNKKLKIIFHSNFNENDKINQLKLFQNKNNVILKELKYEIENYHHKEMIINNKILIFGSLNFLTNDQKDSKGNGFYFEDVCFWIKKEK